MVMTLITLLLLTHTVCSQRLWRPIFKLNKGKGSNPNNYYRDGTATYATQSLEDEYALNIPTTIENNNFRSLLINQWKTGSIIVDKVRINFTGTENKFVEFDATSVSGNEWYDWLRTDYITSSSWTDLTSATVSEWGDTDTIYNSGRWNDRFFYIINYADGCDQDSLWFLVSTATHCCSDWNECSGATNPGIFYSSGTTVKEMDAGRIEGDTMIISIYTDLTFSPTPAPTWHPTVATPAPTICVSDPTISIDTTTLTAWGTQVSDNDPIVPGETFSIVDDYPILCYASNNPCIQIVGIDPWQNKETMYMETIIDTSNYEDITLNTELATWSIDSSDYCFIDTLCNGANPVRTQFHTAINNNENPTHHSNCSFIDTTSCNTLNLRIGGYLSGFGDKMWISEVKYGYTLSATTDPTNAPSISPTQPPSNSPSQPPSKSPTQPPSSAPTQSPSNSPSQPPSIAPTQPPSISPSIAPSQSPSQPPSIAPTQPPSNSPSQPPSIAPTQPPSINPSINPTQPPSISPTQPPSIAPTQPPSIAPSISPTQPPSQTPTQPPSLNPTQPPSLAPSIAPSQPPSIAPTQPPSVSPTQPPSLAPSIAPTQPPSKNPTTPPSDAPSNAPSINPTPAPTDIPTYVPTIEPTFMPTFIPTHQPINFPTYEPTTSPTYQPTIVPTIMPSTNPTYVPTNIPTYIPTVYPTQIPSINPTIIPTHNPTAIPTHNPINFPTYDPTETPTYYPTFLPTFIPTNVPTFIPTKIPTFIPTFIPTKIPSLNPTTTPSKNPTVIPTKMPSEIPSVSPSKIPSVSPSKIPSQMPSQMPSISPTISNAVTTNYSISIECDENEGDDDDDDDDDDENNCNEHAIQEQIVNILNADPDVMIVGTQIITTDDGIIIRLSIQTPEDKILTPDTIEKVIDKEIGYDIDINVEQENDANKIDNSDNFLTNIIKNPIILIIILIFLCYIICFCVFCAYFYGKQTTQNKIIKQQGVQLARVMSLSSKDMLISDGTAHITNPGGEGDGLNQNSIITAIPPGASTTNGTTYSTDGMPGTTTNGTIMSDENVVPGDDNSNSDEHDMKSELISQPGSNQMNSVKYLTKIATMKQLPESDEEENDEHDGDEKLDETYNEVVSDNGNGVNSDADTEDEMMYNATMSKDDIILVTPGNDDGSESDEEMNSLYQKSNRKTRGQ